MNATSATPTEKVVIRSEEFLSGAPMERAPGVRDLKLIYPETGFQPRSLILGIVEIESGCHSPLHRHNCEEAYYVLAGRGVVEHPDGAAHYEVRAGDAVLNRENVTHRVRNPGSELLRLLVVGGIMFVPLVPKWPTASPYEILEDREEGINEASVVG